MFFFFFFTQPELSNDKTTEKTQTEIQMKNILYVPQSGDGIYEELAEIFSKEKRFIDGFNEALAIVKALCAVPDYPFDLNVLIKKTKYQIVSLPLLWVFLRLQPDIDELKKYVRDLEYSLSGVPKAASYLKRCEKSVNDWITKRWEAQKMWLKSQTTVGSTLMFQMPEIIEKQQDLLERITLLEKDNAKIVLQLKQCDKNRKGLEEKVNDSETKLAEKERIMESKEFRDEVGQEYLQKVFEEYLKEADEMEQTLRKDWFNVLQGFCSIEGVPMEVKRMVQSLKKQSANNVSTTVNTQTYIEKQENNFNK